MKIIPIPLSFGVSETIYETNMGFKTADVNSAVLQFTSDTDPVGCVATLTMKNETDNANRVSSVLEQFDVTENSFSYFVGDEIQSEGIWLGDITLKRNLITVCSQKFRFAIGSSLQASVITQLVKSKSLDELVLAIREDVMEHLGKSDASVETITAYLNGVIAKIILSENTRVVSETQRKLNETARGVTFTEWGEAVQNLIDQGIIDQRVQAIIEELQATYSTSLFSLSSQLEQTLNKSAITLTHMFADATARDAYFVAHPTELMEQLFIKVGAGYQQRLGGVWQSSSAIVAEQVSASNQPITDTGNYFTTDNTNAALQELGAHKSSTTNPHGVTKAQVGLGNADNTSDANKPIITAGQTALNLKANKVQGAWITPTLLNGWTEADSAYSVGYMKDEMGFVHFRGAAKGTTNDTFAFTLPVGYRPKQQYEAVIIAGSYTQLCMVRITPTGGVKFTTASLTWNSLEGITFRAEQ